MPIKILMPALSPTMTEGKLASWLKKEGDEVKSGDVIAEIETDKATMEVEAVDEGTLGKILVPEGAEGVKVNDADRACCSRKARTSRRSAATRPAPAAAGAGAGEAGQGRSRPAGSPRSRSRPQQRAAADRRDGRAAQRRRQAPAARRHGDAHLRQPAGAPHGRAGRARPRARSRGSGPHGRIVKADIDAALSAPAPRGACAAAAPAPQPAAAAPPAPLPADAVDALAGTALQAEMPHTTMRRVDRAAAHRVEADRSRIST